MNNFEAYWIRCFLAEAQFDYSTYTYMGAPGVKWKLLFVDDEDGSYQL